MEVCGCCRSVTEKCASAVKKGALYISQLPGVVIRLHWLRLQQKAFRSVTKSRGTERREGARSVLSREMFLQYTNTLTLEIQPN